jgi:hypothetical protein
MFHGDACRGKVLQANVLALKCIRKSRALGIDLERYTTQPVLPGGVQGTLGLQVQCAAGSFAKCQINPGNAAVLYWVNIFLVEQRHLH